MSSITDVLAGLQATSAWQERVYRVYKDLHAHPELSFQETKTAALAASKLKELGNEVLKQIGRTGVVGVTDPEQYERALKADGVEQDIPVNHSKFSAPVMEPTLSLGTQALVVAALTYLAMDSHGGLLDEVDQRRTRHLGRQAARGKGQVRCLPQTIGFTTGGMILQCAADLGIAPPAMLYAHHIDTISAAGITLAAVWNDHRIVTVDVDEEGTVTAH